MKLSFEAKTFGEILDQMNDVLAGFPGPKSKSTTNSEFVENVAPAKAQGPGPDPFNGAGHVDKPVNNPVDKPVEKTKARTAKQLENDERLRERALAKQAEKKAAKAAKADMGAGIVQPVTVDGCYAECWFLSAAGESSRRQDRELGFSPTSHTSRRLAAAR